MKRAIIVIPAADQAGQNRWILQNVPAADDGHGHDTFTVGLSSDGDKPFSHYICSWLVSNADWNLLSTQFDGVDGGNGLRRMYDGETNATDSILSSLRLKATGEI